MDTMKTVYTEHDLENEKKCQESLMQVEESFKSFHAFLTEEINKQRDLADKLWVYSQRYSILQNGTSSSCPYPKMISEHAEYELLRCAHNTIKEIKESIDRLYANFHEMDLHLQEFDKCTKCLDYSTNSPFINGSVHHKPIFYYIETTSDIYSYFRKLICKLKCGLSLVAPSNVKSIDMYQELLKPSEEFDEYIMFFLYVCRNTKIVK